MNKLPAITVSFWIMKIAATTLGETAGDLLSMTLNMGYGLSSLILISIFVVTLIAQLCSSKYHPFLYWTVILSTSTAGTTISDYMDRTLELGYMAGSAILATTLLLVLSLWRLREGSISIQNVTSRRIECYYWAAILVSNTLGTALGDFLADDSGLGFLGGALVISAALMVIITAHYYTHLSKIALFWAAFVLTRPFGATFGDLLTKPIEKGGMDLGTIGSSAVLFTILLVMIIYTHNRQTKRVAT